MCILFQTIILLPSSLGVHHFTPVQWVCHGVTASEQTYIHLIFTCDILHGHLSLSSLYFEGFALLQT